MTTILSRPDRPKSASGHHGTGSRQVANLATRHLCAVTHMRTSMLAADDLDAGDELPTPRRWVGRLYALHVLADRQHGPMPGIDLTEVKRHCWQAIRQTVIRDAAALAVVVTAAWLAPWGTLLLLVLPTAVIAFVGRSKPYSPFVAAAALAAILALAAAGARGHDPFTDPLLAAAACFLIYTADTFWAMRRMRAVLDERPGTTRRHASCHDGAPAEDGRTSADRMAALLGQDPDALIAQLNALGPGSAVPRRRRIRALYVRQGIIGAGTPLTPTTITVAVNKPQKDEVIEPFTASELLDQIASHIESQGTVDNVPDGFAHGQVLIDGEYVPLDIPAPRPDGHGTVQGARPSAAESFTYGLPGLDVSEIVATPASRVKKRPLWWKVMLYVGTASWRRLRKATLTEDPAEVPVPSQSPSAFPARFYVRASTTTWDGELIASVYIGAALQAHYLRLIVRPYVLAPIMPQLRRIEHLIDRGAVVQAALALRGTALAFVRNALAVHRLPPRQPRKRKAHLKETGLVSTRERYAMFYPDDVHHREDAARILDVIEMKVFAVTETFLDRHNVNTEDFKKQIQVFIEKSMVVTGGQNSGNFSVGDNNTQQQSSSGPASGQGQSSGK